MVVAEEEADDEALRWSGDALLRLSECDKAEGTYMEGARCVCVVRLRPVTLLGGRISDGRTRPVKFVKLALNSLEAEEEVKVTVLCRQAVL